jgi:hypothetical protein
MIDWMACDCGFWLLVLLGYVVILQGSTYFPTNGLGSKQYMRHPLVEQSDLQCINHHDPSDVTR